MNCGQVLPRGRPNQRFCRTLCKDRYWSRGTRRVSKMNIKLNTLVDLVEEMIGIMKSNQSRIIKLEGDLKATKELQLLLHQGDM